CIITYCLNSASSVEVRVYDKPNSYIKTLVWGTHVAGAHQVVWDLTDSLNRPVPDGIYRVIIATQIQQIHGDIQVLR
ncbi:MAG: hypothetical protein KKG06_08565, partial [Bacteroidetes bacterium]|nr:hypothetical protein [Bacteroidota bacterium]